MSAKRTVDAALTTQSRVRLGASQAVIYHPHRCLPHKLLPPFPEQVPPRDLEHRPQMRENQFKVTLASKIKQKCHNLESFSKVICLFTNDLFTSVLSTCKCKFLYGFEQGIVKAAS